MSFWPHVFARTGDKEQIGEENAIGDNTATPVWSYRMHCVHCGAEYWSNRESPPAPPCPARNDKREAKRLGVDRKRLEGGR